MERQIEIPFYSGCKIRLTRDLTRYHPLFIIGKEGTMLGGESRLGDRFCLVDFPGVGVKDMLYEGLAHVENDEYRRRKVIFIEQYTKEIDTAYEIKQFVGPRGGFRSLEYMYLKLDGSIGKMHFFDKSDAEIRLRDLSTKGKTILKVVCD